MKSQPSFIRQMWTLTGAGLALATVALALALWLNWAWSPILSGSAVALSVSGIVLGVRGGRRQKRSI